MLDTDHKSLKNFTRILHIQDQLQIELKIRILKESQPVILDWPFLLET